MRTEHEMVTVSRLMLKLYTLHEPDGGSIVHQQRPMFPLEVGSEGRLMVL